MKVFGQGAFSAGRSFAAGNAPIPGSNSGDDVTAEPIQIEAPFTFGAQLDARAAHPALRDKPFLYQNDRVWTYGRYRGECVRMAHFLRERLGSVDDRHPGHVAMFLENHLELLALYGGCAYAGFTLFGINTGLRGEVLAGVINQSRSRLVVVDERLLPAFQRIQKELRHIPPENVLVLRTSGGDVPPEQDLSRRLEEEIGAADPDRPGPEVEVSPEQNLMVIYTSGTTGLPKGINNNHAKLCFIGLAISKGLELRADEVGYACMPLFHSNAMFVGFMPMFWAGASLVVRERFSASGFVPDVLKYGVTYWNYVGEPVHYVLAHIEKQYGGDERRIAEEITRHPRNRLRYAVGNGASPPDIDRFMAWFALEEMFELYGSTEAAISTFRRKGDPRGSVGEITDPAVKILDENGRECPPAKVDEHGRVLNWDECVGEICRVAPDTNLFQGYFDNPEANQQKYRNGVYHSGDLGHVLVRDGKRYLFFDGRTDDWIRKDGENFSAAQVARLLQEHPDVELAAAYGVPCAVSDELVMAALLLRDGRRFDPEGFLRWCEQQVEQGSMDRKWVPDFVRIVDNFEFTQTQKIVVRHLKREHFDRRRIPDAPIFWRRRGDRAYRPFTTSDWETVRGEFARAERLHLLDRS